MRHTAQFHLIMAREVILRRRGNGLISLGARVYEDRHAVCGRDREASLETRQQQQRRGKGQN